MSWILYVVAFVAGALNTVQAGANVTLNKAFAQPIAVALVGTAMNLVAYAIAAPFIGFALPSWDKVASVPWWGWFAGMLGGAYVLAMILIAGKVGSAVFSGITVTAAIITSIALDHFGIVGFEVHEAGIGRLAGGALMICGLLLVCLF